MDFEKFLETKEINTDFNTALYYGNELLQEQKRKDMRKLFELLANMLYENKVFTREWANRIEKGLSHIFDLVLVCGSEYTPETLSRIIFSKRFSQFLDEINAYKVPVDMSPLGESNVSMLKGLEGKIVDIGRAAGSRHAATFHVWMRAMIKFWRMFHLEHSGPKESRAPKYLVEKMASHAFMNITFSEAMMVFIAELEQ